jgi:hypothetical protein
MSGVSGVILPARHGSPAEVAALTGPFCGTYVVRDAKTECLPHTKDETTF